MVRVKVSVKVRVMVRVKVKVMVMVKVRVKVKVSVSVSVRVRVRVKVRVMVKVMVMVKVRVKVKVKVSVRVRVRVMVRVKNGDKMRPINKIICFFKGHRELFSYHDLDLSKRTATPTQCVRFVGVCTRCGELRVIKEFQPNPKPGTIINKNQKETGK